MSVCPKIHNKDLSLKDGRGVGGKEKIDLNSEFN